MLGRSLQQKIPNEPNFLPNPNKTRLFTPTKTNRLLLPPCLPRRCAPESGPANASLTPRFGAVSL